MTFNPMVNFTQEVISRILSASSREEIEEVVSQSATLYEQKTNPRMMLNYLSDMVRELQLVNERIHSDKERDNTRIAIALFRDLYRQTHDKLE